MINIWRGKNKENTEPWVEGAQGPWPSVGVGGRHGDGLLCNETKGFVS